MTEINNLKDSNTDPFNEWKVQLRKKSDELMQNCGLNYEYYFEKLCQHIQAKLEMLDQSDIPKMLSYVKQEYGYLDPCELENALNKLREESNLCQHYFDYDTCPFGCG